MVLVVGQNSVWQVTYRLNRLLAGEVNRIDRRFQSAAGKGSNVVRALRTLGKQAHLIAYNGGLNGRRFAGACAEDELDCTFIAIQGETRTCTTLIENHGRVTELVEPAPAISEEERLEFRSRFGHLIEQASFLVISGTAVGGESESCYGDFIREAKKRGVPVLLDSYTLQGRMALQAGPEILKINQRELEELLGRSMKNLEARVAAHGELRKSYGVDWIIITQGAAGAEGSDGKTVVQVRSPVVRQVNPIGSGDAFSAGVVASLLDERPKVGPQAPFRGACSLSEALLLGTAMGTANCLNMKPGLVEAVDLEKIRGRLKLERLAST